MRKHYGRLYQRAARLLRTLLCVKANEIAATGAAFVFLFILMASYFVLRPVRDALASDWSDREVSFLWSVNFLVSTGIVALYGYAVSRVRFRRVLPAVYGLFATTFLCFYAGMSMLSDRVLVDKAFYLWVSVFSLFHLSVFWSFMADSFNKDQAKRLFAIIAAGGSAGALVGPAVPVFFAERAGLDGLMLIAACGLFSVIPLGFYIYRQKATALGNAGLRLDEPGSRLGGTWWAGFRTLVVNPYFLNIAFFTLLYVFISSFVYFEQKNLLTAYTRTERTQLLGVVDWVVNVLTFAVAFFATGRIAKKLGMPTMLALTPLLVLVGLAILAAVPGVAVVLALQVARRVGGYAITRPAREMLYTEVSEEDRFKAKPVVDVVVYRGGDAVSGAAFAFLRGGGGVGLGGVALVGIGVAALWTWVGVRLGQRYQRKSTTRPLLIRPRTPG